MLQIGDAVFRNFAPTAHIRPTSFSWKILAIYIATSNMLYNNAMRNHHLSEDEFEYHGVSLVDTLGVRPLAPTIRILDAAAFAAFSSKTLGFFFADAGLRLIRPIHATPS
jgi:hypothetical protein